MSLKSAAVRCGLATVAAGSALALTACGAGQISQTANQVPAVDGVTANSANGHITLRDITVHPNGEKTQGSIKFAASNTDPSGKTAHLQSITIDGQKVGLDGDTDIKQNCQIVGDGANQLATQENAPSSSASAVTSEEAAGEGGEARINCVNYLTTSFNASPVPGSSVQVIFTFDSGEIKAFAPVAEPTPESGQLVRNPEGVEQK